MKSSDNRFITMLLVRAKFNCLSFLNDTRQFPASWKDRQNRRNLQRMFYLILGLRLDLMAPSIMQWQLRLVEMRLLLMECIENVAHVLSDSKGNCFCVSE